MRYYAAATPLAVIASITFTITVQGAGRLACYGILGARGVKVVKVE